MLRDATEALPLDAAEVGRLIERFGYGAGVDDRRLRLVLAVSGGVDSMCLMHMMARIASSHPHLDVLAVTVDHGLRPESALEARFIASEAARLSIPHVIKVWTGRKPASGIQAGARAARYRLLAEVYQQPFDGKVRLLTAHTLDDQAETVIMRLARGSGVDGLSGMSESDVLTVPLPAAGSTVGECAEPLHPVEVVVDRPFLTIAKARLVATMRSYGASWVEDPSNANDAFERVRIRRVMAVLQAEGIGAEAIARTAGRMAAARDALDQAVLRHLRSDRVQVDEFGFITLAGDLWGPNGDVPEAIRTRLLATAVRLVGGQSEPPGLRSLEQLSTSLARGAGRGKQRPPVSATLGRCQVIENESEILIVREPGREPPAAVLLQPGARQLWDGRFEVSLPLSAPAAVTVERLGQDGIAWLDRQGWRPAGPPAVVLRALPAFRDANGTMAVPLLGAYWKHRSSPGEGPTEALAGAGTCRFLGCVAVERAAGGPAWRRTS